MGKLKLNLDEIKVESFETENVNLKKGTIIGQLLPQLSDTSDVVPSCYQVCGGCETANWESCNWTTAPCFDNKTQYMCTVAC